MTSSSSVVISESGIGGGANNEGDEGTLSAISCLSPSSAAAAAVVASPSDLRSTVFVGNLAVFCSEKDIEDLFSDCGKVTEVRIARSGDKTKHLAYGFVKYDNVGSAQIAIKKFNGALLCGRTLKVNRALSRANKATMAKSPNAFNSASVHLTFLSHQISELVTEQSLRSLGGQFGKVVDVIISKFTLDEEQKKQSGYGFIHFPLDTDGIEAARRAVDALGDTLLDNVNYRCKISHDLEQRLRCEGMPLAVSTAASNDKLSNGELGQLGSSSIASAATAPDEVVDGGNGSCWPTSSSESLISPRGGTSVAHEGGGGGPRIIVPGLCIEEVPYAHSSSDSPAESLRLHGSLDSHPLSSHRKTHGANALPPLYRPSSFHGSPSMHNSGGGGGSSAKYSTDSNEDFFSEPQLLSKGMIEDHSSSTETLALHPSIEVSSSTNGGNARAIGSLLEEERHPLGAPFGRSFESADFSVSSYSQASLRSHLSIMDSPTLGYPPRGKPSPQEPHRSLNYRQSPDILLPGVSRVALSDSGMSSPYVQSGSSLESTGSWMQHHVNSNANSQHAGIQQRPASLRTPSPSYFEFFSGQNNSNHSNNNNYNNNYGNPSNTPHSTTSTPGSTYRQMPPPSPYYDRSPSSVYSGGGGSGGHLAGVGFGREGQSAYATSRTSPVVGSVSQAPQPVHHHPMAARLYDSYSDRSSPYYSSDDELFFPTDAQSNAASRRTPRGQHPPVSRLAAAQVNYMNGMARGDHSPANYQNGSSRGDFSPASYQHGLVRGDYSPASSVSSKKSPGITYPSPDDGRGRSGGPLYPPHPRSATSPFPPNMPSTNINNTSSKFSYGREEF